MTVELNVFGVRMFKVAFHKRERDAHRQHIRHATISPTLRIEKGIYTHILENKSTHMCAF